MVMRTRGCASNFAGWYLGAGGPSLVGIISTPGDEISLRFRLWILYTFILVTTESRRCRLASSVVILSLIGFMGYSAAVRGASF